jgi:hypothetical protein
MDDDIFDLVAGLRELGDRGVDGFLQGDNAATPPGAVAGDDGARFGVVDAVDDGLGGEATEDDGVWRADAGAGEHGDGEFGDHAHVDGDDVALLDAEFLQGVGELGDIALEVVVGEAADVPPIAPAARPSPTAAGADRLAFPDDGDLVAVALLDLAIDAVVADVGCGADEPFGIRDLPVEDP